MSALLALPNISSKRAGAFGRFTIWCCLLMFFLPEGLAQNQKIDSLQLLLGRQTGKARLPVLMELIDYSRTVDHDLSLQYLAEAERLAGTDTTQKAYADLLLRLGREKAYQGFFGEAVAHYFNALEKYRPYGDTVQAAYTLCDIGIAYAYSNDYDRANRYMRKSLAMFKAADYLKGQADMLNNLGSIMDILGNQDSALVYYGQSLEIKEKLGNQKGLLNGLVNMGVIYKNQKDYAQARLYFDRAKTIAQEINDQEGMLALLINWAELAQGQQKYREAEKWAQQAKAQALAIGNDFRAHNTFWMLSELYQAMGRPEKALEQLQQYVAFSDSLAVKENKKQLAELDARYQNELKEQQIKFLNQQKALQDVELKQRQQLLIFLSVLLLLAIALGGALLLFLKTRQQQKQMQLDHQMRLKQAETDRLKELDQVKSQFFANIAHEFRTPLTLIMGPAEQIRSDADTPKTQKNAEHIGQSAQKLLGLVNQLLDLSKLEAGMMKLHAQPDDLVTFIKGITGAFESLAAEKMVYLHFSTNCPRAIMPIDPERTDKIFVNLLSNAFKFTPDGGTVEVSVEVTPAEGTSDAQAWAAITVKDNGMGIPEELLPHVFTRFYQIEDGGLGTGLGLALVKELTELHGGTVQAKSEWGKGAAFTVRLPLAEADSLTTPAPMPINMPEEKNGRKATPKNTVPNWEELPNSGEQPVLLVIEDNEEVRRFIVRCLWEEYHVLEATDGAEGVRLAAKHLPDLVISDVMMPQKDGLTVCHELKQDPKTSHVPIILLTAKADVEHRIEGLEKGADDYLSKPFHQGELRARVGNIIQTREALRRKFSEAMVQQPEELPNLAGAENAFLEQLKQVLDANLANENFGILQLCREVGMSRTQLHRKLKALTNLSTSHFIRHFRLQRALQLLKQEKFSIAEVAYQVGFSSPSYFTQCFSEVYGFAPSAVAKDM